MIQFNEKSIGLFQLCCWKFANNNNNNTDGPKLQSRVRKIERSVPENWMSWDGARAGGRVSGAYEYGV